MSERGKTKGGCMAVIKTPVAYQKRTALTGTAEHFKIKWGQSIIEGFQPSQNIIVTAWVYVSFFLSFSYSFIHIFSYKIGL